MPSPQSALVLRRLFEEDSGLGKDHLYIGYTNVEIGVPTRVLVQLGIPTIQQSRSALCAPSANADFRVQV